jgi:beta-glucanase (GH16 family)
MSALVVAAAMVLPITPAAAAPAWTLTWQDEFNSPAGSPPDPAKWTHEVGGTGWGNEELQYYTESTRNAAHNGQGQLTITARKETPAGSRCWYGTCKYSSARLITKGKFDQQYGRFEARLKLPRGQGLWPAFWMMGNNYDSAGWPHCGEIDVMENVGSEPQTVYGTLHGPGYSDDEGPGGSTNSPDGRPLADAFHDYAIEWYPDSIRWFIDNKQYLTLSRKDIPPGAKWVYDHPFFMLLNVAVGGSWPGSPNSSTQFPQQLTVEYIHVYRAA